MATRGKGVGTAYESVIRALQQDAPYEEIERRLKQYIGGRALRLMLDRMLARGLIVRRADGYSVTGLGLACLPGGPTQSNHPPLKMPAMPPRREGSDWGVYPSVYAGRTHAYRSHA